MEIVVLNYATGEVGVYTNIPNDWQTEDVCNYLYNELGLNEDETAFMIGDDITINWRKRK